ncbi:CheR family methyltransferase [Candidatus Eisenbacteria bacterium]|uniref:protein-glutamate O-methyltransferase n=1 Tax=Eiseniibacteriota bacterium TaxID=2212470 RepID=A0ABV6YI15_UNCEI
MTTTQALTHDQLQQLRQLLEERCGIRLGDAGHRLIEEGVVRLMLKLGATSFDEFFVRATDTRSGIRDQLANAMISRETQWFRDPTCFQAIGKDALPRLEEDLQCGRADKLRIWSAGCSTGQEPYSVVMTILDRCGNGSTAQAVPSHYEIVATDISPAALFLAVAGRYDPRAMESGLPDPYQTHFFTRDGFVCSLNDSVRKSVRFRQRNLLDPSEGLASGRFHIVLMRYVLEYYSPAMQSRLLERVAESMVPEGLLFLGTEETLPENDWFEITTAAGCPCHRRHQS